MALFENELTDLKDFLQLLKVNHKLLVFALFAGLSMAALAEFQTPTKYLAKGSVNPVSYVMRGNDSIPTPDFQAGAFQLFQILKSQSLRDSLLKRFDLATVYNVSEESEKSTKTIEKRLQKDLMYRRGSSGEVEIIASFNDQELPVKVVNYIIDAAGKMYVEIYQENPQGKLFVIDRARTLVNNENSISIRNVIFGGFLCVAFAILYLIFRDFVRFNFSGKSEE